MDIEFNYFNKKFCYFLPLQLHGLMEIKIVRNSYSWWDCWFVLLSQIHQSIFSGANAVVPWQVQFFYIPEDAWRCLIFLHKVLLFEVFFLKILKII